MPEAQRPPAVIRVRGALEVARAGVAGGGHELRPRVAPEDGVGAVGSEGRGGVRGVPDAVVPGAVAGPVGWGYSPVVPAVEVPGDLGAEAVAGDGGDPAPVIVHARRDAAGVWVVVDRELVDGE